MFRSAEPARQDSLISIVNLWVDTLLASAFVESLVDSAPLAL